jgi:hypothetical protein
MHTIHVDRGTIDKRVDVLHGRLKKTPVDVYQSEMKTGLREKWLKLRGSSQREFLWAVDYWYLLYGLIRAVVDGGQFERIPAESWAAGLAQNLDARQHA